MKKVKGTKGITLVALVITIIVLLILAGISISMLTGQNGILNRAQEAKEKTEDAVLEEKIKLLTAETLINEYTGQEEEKTAQELQNELNNQGENVLVIQWDKYIIFDLNENKEYRVMSDGNIECWGESTLGTKLLNTKDPNQEQIEWDSNTDNIIGLDDKGNTVNMLRWKYTLIDDTSLGKLGTYGLNEKNGLGDGSTGRTTGYKENYQRLDGTLENNYNEDGTIKGTVPAYISIDGGNTYATVTSMVHTFYRTTSLKEAPDIPNTITNMSLTFFEANNLLLPPKEIPDSVIDLSYCFYNCTSMNHVPVLGKNIIKMVTSFANTAITEFNVKIPNKVIDMTSTFYNCNSLNQFSTIIPNSVTNMQSTFQNCSKLIEFDSQIPNSVTNMQSTFSGCELLEYGPSTIPNSVTNMFQTFINCKNLQGKIEINANISEETVYEWNGNKYKGYDDTFKNAGTNRNGIVISKVSACKSEILNKWSNLYSKVTIEE